jgi:hypothetical protein
MRKLTHAQCNKCADNRRNCRLISPMQGKHPKCQRCTDAGVECKWTVLEDKVQARFALGVEQLSTQLTVLTALFSASLKPKATKKIWPDHPLAFITDEAEESKGDGESSARSDDRSEEGSQRVAE